ncbi:alpha/beta hydrolase [Herbaspirillum sp. 1130]|uniref:alpha/beta hydrolase family protein n=1 Tax=Herbaspirillum sp. 1130 TaxID=2806562 RepID=UPI001AE75DE3|nr:alpha/beta hydrolase [Herbaspirillum sp. 1130]MBP1314369.1 pimeloyl-ACP methyl ester carboxylesterase [Herbaspirillum sp. 1130]
MLKTTLAALIFGACFTGHAFAANSDPDDEALNSCLKSQHRSTPEEEFSLFYRLQSRAPTVMSNVKRIYYGKKLDQYGDLRLPPGQGPFPVAIVVHGGNWLAVVNSDYMAPVAEILTNSGFATWNIEYSRIGSGGGWPGSFQSIAAATDFVRDLAKIYPLDLNRVMSIGHSSGGHYALWMASRKNIRELSEVFVPNPLQLKGAIALDGSPDIDAFGKLPRGKVIIPQLIGSTEPAVISERMRDISPTLLLPTGGKIFIISQDSDRAPMQREYVRNANAKGDRAAYDIICPANHFTTADTENPVVREKIIRYSHEVIDAR